LLVEDDPNLNRSLPRSSSRPVTSSIAPPMARNGLYLAREYPVNLAIIDLGLPKLSGVELIKQLRADGQVVSVLVFDGA